MNSSGTGEEEEEGGEREGPEKSCYLLWVWTEWWVSGQWKDGIGDRWRRRAQAGMCQVVQGLALRVGEECSRKYSLGLGLKKL